MLGLEREKGTDRFSDEGSGFKHRDRAAIIADILCSLVKKPRGTRKTHLKQSANLSTPLLNKYLSLLLLNGLVKLEDEGIYKTTTKGLRLLQNLNVEYFRMTGT